MNSTIKKVFFLFSIVLLFAGIAFFFQSGEGGCGDKPQHFRAVYWGAGIGAALGFLALLFLDFTSLLAKRLIYLVQIGLRYFLGYTIISYGVAKVLDMQFALNHWNLDARLVDMTPMQVAWSFFGYSYVYSAFVGWSQVIGGTLLFFRRTATFGAVLLFTIMLNIVLVNFCFDVCVKLNSTVLLLMNVSILLWAFFPLWKVFFTDEEVAVRVHTPLFGSENVNRLMLVLRTVLVLGYLVYSFYQVIQLKQQYGIGEENAVKGAWKINKLDFNSIDSTHTNPLEGSARLFFGNGKQLMSKQKDVLQAKFLNYKLIEETDSIFISDPYYNGDTLMLKGIFKKPDSENLNIQVNNEKDTLNLKLLRLHKYDIR